METDWTKTLAEKLRRGWGPLCTEVVAGAEGVMREAATAAKEHALGRALSGQEATLELHRDPAHGFVLTAYAEDEGRYRAPHDHGLGWVVYVVAEGAVEMGTFAAKGEGGRLVRRDSTRMGEGAVKLFLPGDIHDTLCLSGRAVILRLTSCDLKKEQAEGRMKRYPEAVSCGRERPAGR